MSLLTRAFLALTLAIGSLGAHAQSADSGELPPVDSVFKLTASAPSRELIEVRWQIAPGYYLYRHRTQVEPLGGFAAGELQIPAGQKHHDEFFGDVETYRGELKVSLPGTARADNIALRVKYQGCADIGLCYPPQTRTVNVRLPAATQAAAADSSFAALGQSLGGGQGGGLNILGGKAQPLPPEQAFRMEAIADGGTRLLLRATPARGYYLYRDKISLRLEGAHGITLGKPVFPAARNHHDEHFGAVKVYFDEAEIPIPLTRTGEGSKAQEITLQIGWQGCQEDGICYEPMRKSFRLALPAVDDARQTQAVAVEVPATTQAADDAQTQGDLASPGSDELASTDADSSIASPVIAPDDSPAQGAQRSQIGLVAALLLALGGGLILNLMPCVLPVLSLKALALAQSGESPAHARRHAIWYTAGVLSAFALLGGIVLALRQQLLSDGMSWGFQLQLPWVVAALALVVFAFGLSLSGLWYAQIAAPRAGLALSQKSGHTGDFFTGVLAVVLATPCTAPFMGAALAYAFLAPASAALLVFLMLGLGLALPFLLIGFIPQLGRFLPKPGAWMETMKQLLAFPMYATAAWLVWVLVQQRGADAFGLWALAAIALTLVLWAWTRMRTSGKRWLLILAIPALIASLWAVHGIHRLPTVRSEAAESSDNGRVAYSPERLANLRSEGRAVFVNITADWCVTCKANERAVLSRDDFKSALAETGVTYMVGDHTDVDPQISAFLREHGAVGLPLYVVYPANGAAPQILPVVLTPAIAREALMGAVK